MARTWRTFFRVVQLSVLRNMERWGDQEIRSQGRRNTDAPQARCYPNSLRALNTILACICGFAIAIFVHAGFAPHGWFLSTAMLPVAAQVPAPDLREKTTPRPPSAVVQGSLTISQLVQQGRELYSAGKFPEAVEVWEQAAKNTGDVNTQAMVWSNISLAYQHLDKYSEAEAAINTSLQLLNTRPNTRTSKERFYYLGLALNTQGSLQLAQGTAGKALETWKEAANNYRQARDETGVTQALLNQAQAMQELGQNRRAKEILEGVNQTLEKQPDSLLKAAALRSLGDALQLVGDLKESRMVLEQSRKIAQQLNSPQDISAALLSLGNTARAQQKNTIGDTAKEKRANYRKEALDFYENAAKKSASPITRLQAQLNQLSLLVEIERLSKEQATEQLRKEQAAEQLMALEQLSKAQDLWPQILSQIDKLPPIRTVVYARINLALSLMKLRENLVKLSVLSPESLVLYPQSLESLLNQAVQQAKTLEDQRTYAYALGYLGELYLNTNNLNTAKKNIKQALFIAQANNAPDIAYRWQWQLGRLLKSQGDREGAIATYDQAIETLQSLRSDLVATNRDVQYSFKESVEPVYRQFVDLLLQTDGTGEPSQKNLVQARQVIESLQLAELDNFFGEACLQPKQQLDEVVDKDAPTTAIIYPIILEHRLDVILKLPKQPLLYHSTTIDQNQVEAILKKLGHDLSYRRPEAQQNLQQVYNWLIKPFDKDLANLKKSEQTPTLVFVLDGSLRNIPMAALHDGQQYLIKKYAVALAPSLQLFDLRRLPRERLRILTAGITEAVEVEGRKFEKLESVPIELEEIAKEVSIQRVVRFVDSQFIEVTLEQRIKSGKFSIVHMATHGNFSSDVQQTFILSYNKLLRIEDLKKLLQASSQGSSGTIELLVLSACETAEGDNRAILGLAGVAVRAGARSTLSTLWEVNDEATAKLMGRFYQELVNPTVTKAEALRRAQLSIMNEYRDPFKWAPYVLVGNWL